MNRYMVWAFFAMALFTAPAQASTCSDSGNWQCADGPCISMSSICNGLVDCPDASDEASCGNHYDGGTWQCADGTYININAKCDGLPDCPDNSDETHAVCHNHYCHPTRFRCAYGACVDSSAPCNDFPNCLDHSDELIVKCHNTTHHISGHDFLCNNGDKIPISEMCDGEKQCADGSDETVAVCTERRCRRGQFQCKYGACVSASSMCDSASIWDCADGSDEDHILCNRPLTVIPNTTPVAETPAVVDRRGSEQEIPSGNDAKICREDQWKCHDGSCISEEGRCDGQIDCHDRSDESHAVCRKNYCHESRFRCQYGACVDRTSLCNGVSDCADGSDEIPRVCRNETLIQHNEFNCNNGDIISANELCDGRKDCADGSDETLDSCAGWFCAPRHFQCAYGACVNANSRCDLEEHWDCADGSDEDSVLCNRPQTVIPNTTPKHELELCILPDNPEHGRYTVHNVVGPAGNGYQSFELGVDCYEPYRSDGPLFTQCTNGHWTSPPQQCKQFCELPRHHSITYFCGDRKCERSEPSGTVATPQCNSHFVPKGELKAMNCIFNTWDYIPTCVPEIKAKKEGNKITLYIGKELVVHLDGSQYTVSMEYDSNNIFNERIPDESENTVVPNAPDTDTVVPNTPEGPRRLNPAFHPQYDPIAWSKKHDKN